MWYRMQVYGFLSNTHYRFLVSPPLRFIMKKAAFQRKFNVMIHIFGTRPGELHTMHAWCSLIVPTHGTR